jgi:hypothetical protein
VSPLLHIMLQQLVCILPKNYDNLVTLSVLFIICFGCLRSSELCLDLASPPLRRVHFRFYSTYPKSVRLHVPSSKTAPHGFELVIGCSGSSVCAVCALELLFGRYPRAPKTPVFLYTDGRVLRYPLFNTIIKHLVSMLGLDPRNYTPHSLRAGAATAAAAAGFTDAEVKSLGRWKSI